MESDGGGRSDIGERGDECFSEAESVTRVNEGLDAERDEEEEGAVLIEVSQEGITIDDTVMRRLGEDDSFQSCAQS